MTCSKRVRTMVTMIALAGLGACLAGCVSDLGAATGEAATSPQMRYYGGPKSPMWPAQRSGQPG